MKIFLLYFLVVNIFVFILAGYDKNLARKNKRRIPENTLFFLQLIGGTPGLLTAMFLFRHKTRKTSFIVKFILILLVQAAFVYLKLSGRI
ncbi:DUF1294 domain-containing protein [Flavobacterium johnsoniae]|uniref:DUF1294 domain-containing protein n=1 Tax=Flavobacterium johnsoniae TaxID=986 RepID=UPI0011EE30FC|nr:DUF1294 domain-containing protein [Flavobacterium johnsoniae]